MKSIVKNRFSYLDVYCIIAATVIAMQGNIVQAIVLYIIWSFMIVWLESVVKGVGDE